MASAEHRLRILEMAKPVLVNPDLNLWIENARKIEAYVDESGHAEKAPEQSPQTLSLPQARNTRPLPAPARK